MLCQLRRWYVHLPYTLSRYLSKIKVFVTNLWLVTRLSMS